MLVLSRTKSQSLIIDENIEVIVLEIGRNRVKLGIAAPRNLTILRKELCNEKEAQNIILD